MTWLWIPITIGAALAQTLRNAAQRHLTRDLGALGATLVRFLYGLPFAALWLGIVMALIDRSGTVPALNAAFFGWTILGAVTQIAATALLLRNMEERNFAVGVAYSKTEVIQVAIFGLVLLGDRLAWPAVVAIVLATLGVMLQSMPGNKGGAAALISSLASRSALLGIASGAAFALAAVGYRGGALALETPSVFLAAAYTLIWAQSMQTVFLGGYLLATRPDTVRAVIRQWRVSLLAGLMGALASMGWFTAMAMQPVAQVRTLGLIELFFSYFVSRRLFKERFGRAELLGYVLLTIGLFGILAGPVLGWH